MTEASLIVQVQERFTEFLRTQSLEQLQALAEGKLHLVLSAGNQSDPDPVAPQAGPRRAKLTGPRTPEKKAAAAPAAASPAAARRVAASSIEPAAMAATLRGFDSVDEGVAYFESVRKTVTKDFYMLVGAELGVTIGKSLNKPDMEKKLLNQAIGARRKFAGLSHW